MRHLYWTLKVGNAMTDPASVTFGSNPSLGPVYGVRRNDTGEQLVAAGVPLTKVTTGVYRYDLIEPVPNLQYTYAITFVYDGTQYYDDPQISDVPQGVSVESIRSEVQTRLGISGIDVELVDADYDNLLKQTLRILNRQHPPLGKSTLNFTGGQTKYAIAHPGLYGVTDVDVLGTADCNLSCDPFTAEQQLRDARTGVGIYRGDTYGDLLQRQTYDVDRTMLTGSDAAWQGQWINGQYYLFIRAAARSLVSYEYVWHYTPDNNADTGVGRIVETDLDWVINYTVALAKQVLARVLRKHGGINMPDGSVEPMDGDALAQEGREDEQTLLAELKERRRPLTPVIG